MLFVDCVLVFYVVVVGDLCYLFDLFEVVDGE